MLSLKVLYSFELVITKLVILDFMVDALGAEDLGFQPLQRASCVLLSLSVHWMLIQSWMRASLLVTTITPSMKLVRTWLTELRTTWGWKLTFIRVLNFSCWGFIDILSVGWFEFLVNLSGLSWGIGICRKWYLGWKLLGWYSLMLRSRKIHLEFFKSLFSLKLVISVQ